MDQLLGAWTWFLEQYSTNPVVATITSYLIIFVAGKLGNIGAIILEVRRAIKDGKIKDVEMARIAWRVVSVLYGWWPNESKKIILKYAPDHQVKIILGKG